MSVYMFAFREEQEPFSLSIYTRRILLDLAQHVIPIWDSEVEGMVVSSKADTRFFGEFTPVNLEESKILAHVIRNWATKARDEDWTPRMRPDIIDKMVRFADWCETSGGFLLEGK